MAYKKGYCPQCGIQITVQDTNGKWNSIKANFRQAYLGYENSPMKLKIVICASCLESPNLEILFNAITAEDSDAANSQTKEYIKAIGIPTKIEIAASSKQGKTLSEMKR